MTQLPAEEGSLIDLAQKGLLPPEVANDVLATSDRPGHSNARAILAAAESPDAGRVALNQLGAGLDFSYSISQGTAAAMFGAGYRVVFIYTKWNGRPTVEACRAAGMLVKPIHETTGVDYRGGRGAGNSAAHANVSWANYNGYDPTATINTFDEDVLGYGRGGLAIDYDRGWMDVQGVVDSYGAGQLLDLLHNNGVCRNGWSTLAWSGGYIPGWVFAWQGVGVTVAGVSCDYDRIYNWNGGFIGQAAPGPGPAPVPTGPPEPFWLMEVN